MIKVLVNGASGKMGVYTVAAIKAATDLELVATCNSQDNLEDALLQHTPDVAVDFTLPHCIFVNIQLMIKHNVHPVIGTSGLTPENIKEITKACSEKNLGGIFAPNFSVGAVLMMKYAKEAASYFSYAEIIERHHEKKVDAPSGTAAHTQQLVQQYIQSVPTHSVRMPGVFAEQEVIFGGQGETFTISHKAIDRECMMPGVVLACEKVTKMSQFVIGLEHLL
jgi:4-hydroxy-tetrahydrodipicolinate reductase